jgi:hypothetical protein
MTKVGMPHERIIASAIYYYGRDPSIVDAGLYLRRKRNDDEWPGRAHWTNREVRYHTCQYNTKLTNRTIPTDVQFVMVGREHGQIGTAPLGAHQDGT